MLNLYVGLICVLLGVIPPIFTASNIFCFSVGCLNLIFYIAAYQTVTKITLDKDNRMARVGFGKHEGKWFFRIDLWSIGYRITPQ